MFFERRKCRKKRGGIRLQFFVREWLRKFSVIFLVFLVRVVGFEAEGVEKMLPLSYISAKFQKNATTTALLPLKLIL